jgi:hypothetical protein
MRLLLVSVGKDEYLFQRKVADVVRRSGWDAELVTLGHYNLDYKTPPPDTTVVEERIPGLFARPKRKLDDLDAKIHWLENEFGVPCIRRLCFTDRIHRPRLKEEWQSAQVLWQYVTFWKDFLAEKKCDLGFMSHGGEMIRWGAFHNCKKQNIPLYQEYFCPLPRRVFFKINMDYDLEVSDWNEEEPISDDEKHELLSFMHGIQEGRRDFLIIRQMDFQWTMPLLLVRAYFRKYVTAHRGYSNALLWNYTKESFWKITRKHLVKMLYSQPRDDERFIFYPIHYIDDAQIVIRAPHYYDQFALMEIMAKALPYGFKLYVKEHPSLIGCFPFEAMWRLKKRCSNVRIIHPLYHPHKLIKKASAVATINSTAGFEAIIFKKPLLVFGKAFYRGAGLSTDVGELHDLPAKIAAALTSPVPSDERVIQFLATLKRYSFDAEIMQFNPSNENAEKVAHALLELARQPRHGSVS